MSFGLSATQIALITLAATVATTAAGAGMSYYGQQQQAANAERVAQYNAQIQQQNANRQRQIAQIQAQNSAVEAQNYQSQARAAQYQALQNQQIAFAQYRQGQNNALTIEANAKAQEAQGREKARRLRMEQDRTLAMQRGKFAKSGVVNEGSPLAVLADTARLTELNIQDSAHEVELNRQTTLQKAELERFQSGFSLLDANMEGYKGGIAKYQEGIGAYNERVAAYEGASADTARKIAYREADLTRMSGAANAQGYRIGATSSLISGAGQIAGSVSDYGHKNGSTSIPVRKATPVYKTK